MASEIDQILHTTGDATTTDAKTLFGAKSDIVVASSSNVAIENMVKKDVHVLTHYWKKSIVIEVDRSAYHAVG
jgi:hypothetical protein